MSVFDDEPDFWDGVEDDILDVFGAKAAEYRPKEGSPVPFRAIFRKARGQVAMTGPGLARPVKTGSPAFTAKGPRHVLAGAREGETLAVQGEVYSISDVKFEGVGLVTLHLQGPVVEPARHNANPAGSR